jgi:predicted secreted hydrolase
MRYLLPIILVFLVGCAGEAPPEAQPMSVAEALAAGDDEGYDRVLGPREFDFPEDHGPHPGYRTEWWYITGNLDSEDGRRFGYQFTIFRSALALPDEEGGDTGWSAPQLYMGHVGLTDVEARRFRHSERLGRPVSGIAGAQVDPFRVWVDDWSLTSDSPELDTMRLQADVDGDIIDLTLIPQKPMVLQGDRGFDRKGEGEGNASHYYSFTRIQTQGTITLNGQTIPVSGYSWMDREWSTSVLGEGVEGWDWFSLQFADGRDMMFYQLRDVDGHPVGDTGGALVQADGAYRKIETGEVRLDVLDRWTSPRGGSYPSRWRLFMPDEGIDIEIRTVLGDQEMVTAIRYYEGAIDLLDAYSGEKVGRGYVEMTGYAEGTAGGLRG